MIEVPRSLNARAAEAVDELAQVMNGNPREQLLQRRADGGDGVTPGERRIRTTTRIELSDDRGVFMISVAAELAEMHPQTLRMYEQRGLIEPKRSPKGTRLYSQADVERLRRIQEMTAELGMNLAGVERVFELEQQLNAMTTSRCAGWRSVPPTDAPPRSSGSSELRRSLRAEIVPYVPPVRALRPHAAAVSESPSNGQARTEEVSDAARPLHDQVPGGDPGRAAAGRGPRATRRSTPEHLLRGAARAGRAASSSPVLRKVGADPGAIRAAVNGALDDAADA